MGSKFYLKTISFFDKFVPNKFQPLWNHPAGPKTVFFWAPTFKWGLVIAGLGDIQRPANQISIPQTTSLALTSIIWTRWATVIIPKNWNLFCVNSFILVLQLYHLQRALRAENIEEEESPKKKKK